MKAWPATLMLVAALLASLPSRAVETVTVTNAAQLSWFYDTPSGRIYFRNFDQFDSRFLGCCYNWYIDTTTVVGRTLWATILLKMAGAQPINLMVGAPNVAGPVLYGGNW